MSLYWSIRNKGCGTRYRTATFSFLTPVSPGIYSANSSYASSPTVTNVTGVLLRAGFYEPGPHSRSRLLTCARARILFIRFLYAILVMPFVNTEAVVKIATLRVSGLSLTRIPTMLNDTPRVSKYFPMQPASPSELSLHFFSRSVCLLYTTRAPLTHSHGFRSFYI